MARPVAVEPLFDEKVPEPLRQVLFRVTQYLDDLLRLGRRDVWDIRSRALPGQGQLELAPEFSPRLVRQTMDRLGIDEIAAGVAEKSRLQIQIT